MVPLMLPGSPFARVRTEIARVLVGQDRVITELLTALLCGGHVLLEGVPGVAKTLAAKSLAQSLDLRFGRVQFTPDLMPADVLGTLVFQPQRGEFELRKGPIFTDLLLADEINRTPPKTQAALLEAMEERQVTLDGVRHPLGDGFFVIATQNPVEYEGTYPLPEAQSDRFLMKVKVDYPDESAELEILRRSSLLSNKSQPGTDAEGIHVEAVLSAEELRHQQSRSRSLPASEPILHYVAALARKTRELGEVRLGCSPRGAVALISAARARATLAGDSFVTPDHVKAVALPVLRHRLILRPEADFEGVTSDHVVERLLGSVDVPR